MHSALSILIFMVLNQRTADSVLVDPGPDQTPTKTASRLETSRIPIVKENRNRTPRKTGPNRQEKPDPTLEKKTDSGLNIIKITPNFYLLIQKSE